MKKQNLLMLLAVMAAVFAFTAVSAQAAIDYSDYIITDFDGLYDFSDSGSRNANGYYGQDFTVATGSPDIMISGFDDESSSGDLAVSNESFWVESPAFEVGDRVSIDWDGDLGNVSDITQEVTYQNIGLRFEYLDGGVLRYMVLVWYPYQGVIGGYVGGAAGNVAPFVNGVFNAGLAPGAKNTLYIEKQADGWAYGSIIDGVDTVFASGVQSGFLGGTGSSQFGIWSDLRTLEQTWTLSNLTVYQPKRFRNLSSRPDPSTGESSVEVNLLDRLVPGAVSWDIIDPNGTVLGYNVYMDTDETTVRNATAAAPGTLYSSLQSNGQTGTSFDPGADLAYDTTYYWRVDSVVDLPAPGTDPNIFTGNVWTFETRPITIITTQPVRQYAFPGETATFTIGVDSDYPVTYTWKRSTDDVAENGDETGVGGNSSTLAVSPVASFAYYYCVVDNGSTTPLISDVVYLQINRQTARYNFENNADDTSSNPPVADGTWADSGSQEAYSTGLIGSYAADFTGDPNSYISVPAANAPLNGDPTIGGGQTGTVAYWIKSTNSDPMIVIGTSNTSPDYSAFVVFHNQDVAGQVKIFQRAEKEVTRNVLDYVDTNLLDGQWHHIAFTWDFSETGSVLFVDGEAVANNGDLVDMDWNPWEYDMPIGAATNVSQDGQTNTFLTGELDDVLFYNYALTSVDVADVYLQGYPDAVLCVANTYAALYDTNGNCKIDLGDFAAFANAWLSEVDLEDLAAFANAWLDCGMYPVSNCD